MRGHGELTGEGKEGGGERETGHDWVGAMKEACCATAALCI
jgi:hypothetical protein